MLSPAEVRRLVGQSCPLDDRQLADLTQQFYALADFAVDGFRVVAAREPAPPARRRGGPLLRLVPPEVLEDAEERAAIREFDGGMSRAQAERRALDDLRTLGLR